MKPCPARRERGSSVRLGRITPWNNQKNTWGTKKTHGFGAKMRGFGTETRGENGNPRGGGANPRGLGAKPRDRTPPPRGAGTKPRGETLPCRGGGASPGRRSVRRCAVGWRNVSAELFGSAIFARGSGRAGCGYTAAGRAVGCGDLDAAALAISPLKRVPANAADWRVAKRFSICAVDRSTSSRCRSIASIRFSSTP